MFRPTASLAKQVTRKLQLTPKQSPKDYYKGYGSGAMGRHTKHGGYKIDYSKVRSYVVPSTLDISQLTPFVSDAVERPRVKTRPNPKKLLRALQYQLQPANAAPHVTGRKPEYFEEMGERELQAAEGDSEGKAQLEYELVEEKLQNPVVEEGRLRASEPAQDVREMENETPPRKGP